MGIPLSLLNQEFASSLITLAGQSILISFVGIIIIKLISGKSAPVRSLVCTATIVSMIFVFFVSIGLRWSGISWSHTTISVSVKSKKTDSSPSFGPDNEQPFAPVSPEIPKFPSLPETVKKVSFFEISTFYSRLRSLPASAYINMLGFVWFAGILFQLLRLGYGIVLVKSFRNGLRYAASTALKNMMPNITSVFWNKCRPELYCPELYCSALIESPITIGIVNPIVIIPEKLLPSLSENELKSILLHELAHIYHYDQVVGLLKRVLTALFWWNPIVYEISNNHEQAREEVADNYVLNELDPRVYTQCLMNLAEKVCLISNFPTAAGMAGRRFNLKERVEQILSKKRSVAIRTNLYLKSIAFAICLAFAFLIGGLHARVIKVNALYDAAKDLQKTLYNIGPTSFSDEKQTPLPEDVSEPETMEQTIPETATEISDSAVTPQMEFSDKSIAEKATPVVAKAVANDDPMASSERAADIDDVLPTAAEVDGNITKDRTETVQRESGELSPSEEKTASNAALYLHRGVSDLKKGLIEDAIDDFNRAIDLDPRNAVAYIARGSAYFRLDRFDNAVSDYNKAIEVNPNHAAAYQNRGSVYYRQGKFDDAISDYNRAIEIDPDLAAAYIDRGGIFQFQNRNEEAISDYSKALKLNPRDAITYNSRGLAYFTEKQYQKAFLDFNRVIKLDPGIVSAYIYRAYYYQIIGEYANAIADFSKVIILNPNALISEKLRKEISRIQAKGDSKGGTKDTDQKTVCRRRPRTGSNLKQIICTTKAEQEEASSHAKEFLNEIIALSLSTSSGS